MLWTFYFSSLIPRQSIKILVNIYRILQDEPNNKEYEYAHGRN